jgi:PhnB protein
MSFKATPFILLDGQAREAIRFYEAVLDARVVLIKTYGEAPEAEAQALPADARERITHSVLVFGGAELYVADCLPGEPAHAGPRVQICVTAPNVTASTRIFDALKEGGEVVAPLAPVYFSPAYGIVRDRYGVTFQIFTERSTAN